MPSQPSSAICAQFSADQPFSVAAILRRVSNGYLSRTNRSAASCSCFCSSERDRSICSSSKIQVPLPPLGGEARRGEIDVRGPLSQPLPLAGERRHSRVSQGYSPNTSLDTMFF